MTTAEQLWSARSADAKAFADSLTRPIKPPKSTKRKPLSDSKVKFELESEDKAWYETPIVQGVIDALSVGTYTMAAGINATAESARAGKSALENGGGPLDAVGAYLNEGMDQTINHNPLVMGIKAAGGDDDSRRTFADVIKNAQSIGGGEEYANAPAQRIAQGIGGFAGDVLLDPTNAIGTGAAAKIAGGAIKGGTIGAKAAKDIAKGGESLGRPVGRIAGMKAGAKEGKEAYKVEKAEELEFAIQKRDLNKALKDGVPLEVIRENVKGFDFLPENLLAGKKSKVSEKDLRKARAAAKASEDVLTKPLPEMPEYGIFKVKGEETQNPFDSIVQASKAPVGEEVPTEVIPTQPTAKERLANPESITPAYNYVDNPGTVNAGDFINDSPVDEFVKGTAHLTADVPRMQKKTQAQIQNFLQTHPSVKKTVKSPAVYNADELRRFLISGSLRQSTKNPERVITGARGRAGAHPAKNTFFERKDLAQLIDDTVKKNEKKIHDLIAAGKFQEADDFKNAAVSRALRGKVYVDDLNKIVQSVKGGIVTDEVIEFAWVGAKPTPSQLNKLGFKGDLREAMRTIREFGQNLNSLSRKSGAFREILDAYRNGVLPVEDMARFEEFASTFFKLEGADRLNKDRIIELASDFLVKNKEAIMTSSLLHAPMAQSGRLMKLGGGGSSEAKGLLRILPPDSATKYARPFNEGERIQIIEAMAQKTEADIINGISPEFVGRAADKIIEKHFTEYATPAGEFVTKNGWRTSTMNLSDGLPKKEHFWTTHSAIDLFSKINSEVRTFMQNIPELDEIRRLAKSKPTAVNKKNYEAAYRSVKDNLYMRILAQVDVNLKAHGIFGYLTNAMPMGDTAVRLSMYDVMNAMGPELRMKHLWTPQGDVNNFRVTQVMDVAETLIRTLKGSEVTGEIDEALMLKNAREVMKGNFTKNSDAKQIAREIQQNLDESIQKFNDGIIDGIDSPKANAMRNGKYTQFINAFMNKVGDDDLTPLQRVADTALRNTALHASHFGPKIVMATEEQMARLKMSLESGTVGHFADVVSSVVRPDKFEPEVSKVFKDEIRQANLSQMSLDEMNVSKASAEVSKLSSGKEMVLYVAKEIEPELYPTKLIDSNTYSFPVGPKPKGGSTHRLKLSSADAREVMLNGRRLLTDGKQKSTKWPTHKFVSVAGDRLQAQINAANAKVATAARNNALHPDAITETVVKQSDEQIVNLFRQELAHDVTRRMFVGQNMFNVRFGKEISYDTVTSGMHLGTALETAFHGAINDYARKYSMVEAKQAMADIQSMSADVHAMVAKGEMAGLSPATIDMAKLTGAIFDAGTNNWYVRNGVGPKLMNDILADMTNVPWRFPTMIDGELVTPAQMSQIWKTWTNIDNPFKAFAAIHTAMIKASSDISMGARFSSYGSPTIPKGEEANWAKINFDKMDTLKNKNHFVELIDRELYYPKDIIAELPEWGRFITMSRTFKNEKFQQWVNSFDEFTSALKLTQTSMKPGHHVMSVIGDFFANRLAGVTGMGDMKDSWKVLRSRNAADAGLSELDRYARIKELSLGGEVATKSGGNGVKMVIGGKPILMDTTAMYDLFTQRGIFLPAHQGGVAEDLNAIAHAGDFDNLPGGNVANAVTKGTKTVNNAVSGLVNNKLIKLNSFTAQRDNLFRGELAIHAMKSKNFKSIEDALNHAETIVRKWKPTAKDLTAIESKYNRRIFLYYTWLRGMIPRVVEGAIARPAIATMPSKAMYNVAIANGLDPNSFGDPFDPNEMFPEYYTNGVLGPQWQDPNSGHLWGMNPTAPIIDVFNSVGAGATVAGMVPFTEDNNAERVSRTLLGMTNPIFRSPVELAMMRNIGTDTPIMDSGQYLTDMPGPVRYISKVTGHTLNPALGGIPRRAESKYKEGMDEEQWAQNATMETINFLTGLGFRDYTSDSARKSAEFDEKDKLKQEQNNETRMGW